VTSECWQKGLNYHGEWKTGAWIQKALELNARKSRQNGGGVAIVAIDEKMH
jgi:hypothetical protein